MQKEEKWSGREWKRGVSFRVELLKAHALNEGLKDYILLWWEYTLVETLSMGHYNWTKLHFIWMTILYFYYDPIVTILNYKIIFWIAVTINWNCSPYKQIGSTDFDSHLSH